MKRSHYLLFFLLFLSLTACRSHRGSDDWSKNTVYMIPERKPITLTNEQQQFVTKNNDFACRLFAAVESGNPNTSTLVSPLSVTYLLGMLNAGANGDTKTEITQVLGFGDDNQAVNEFCHKMLNEAPFVDSGVTVETGNAIYVNSDMGISLKRDYVNTVNRYYQADIQSLDFSKESSVKRINSWCNKQTHGMIPTIIDELSPDMVMMLLNSIYIKATWNEKFDPEDTHPDNFTKADGNTVRLQMMHRHAYAQYSVDTLFNMLCLPYGDKGYCMYVIIPNEGQSTDDVINHLMGERLEQAVSQSYKAEVDILLPRFETAFETELNDILSNMGMPSAFDRAGADFSKICDYNLYVSQMLQKAKIEVDEEGTKASAVTVAMMALGGAVGTPLIRPKKVDFHANRPFIYFIRESSTGTIFFMGKYQGE